MKHDYTIDDSIIKELLKTESGFNELFRKLRVVHPTLNRLTLSRHMEKLYDKRVINKKEQTIGKKGEIRISPDARDEIKFGIFQRYFGQKKTELDLSREEKSRNAIHLILSVASSGSSSLVPVSTPKPGDVAIPISEDLSKGFRSFSTKRSEGFSPSDIINKMWLGANAGSFRSPELLPNDMRRILDHLKEESIIRQISISGETRFGIVDNELSDFIEDSLMLFSSVMLRMLKAWNYRKPKRNEVDWVRSFYGRRDLIRIFRNSEEVRMSVNSKSRRLRMIEKKEIERQIRLFDSSILRQFDKSNVRRKMIPQYSVFSKMFTDASYPEFLQNLQKKGMI